MMTLRQRVTGTTSYNAWLQSMRDLIDALHKLDEAGTPTVVVEGIFWPASKSLLMLQNECLTYEWVLEEHHLEVPANIAVSRVLADYERDLNEQRFFGRLFLIGKYLGGFK
jgi:hypothetical protein